jgi:uncharacterized membrane protein
MWCGSGLQLLVICVLTFVSGFVVAMAAMAYIVTTKEDPESQALTPPPW